MIPSPENCRYCGAPQHATIDEGYACGSLNAQGEYPEHQTKYCRESAAHQVTRRERDELAVKVEAQAEILKRLENVTRGYEFYRALHHGNPIAWVPYKIRLPVGITRSRFPLPAAYVLPGDYVCDYNRDRGIFVTSSNGYRVVVALYEAEIIEWRPSEL